MTRVGACWLAMVMGLILALTGCERAPERPTSTPPKTTITFLHYFTDSLSGGIDDMARSFNNSNTQYELKAVSLDHEAFKTSIQESLKSDQPPDLYAYWAGARTASLVADLEPLDDVWQKARLDQVFAPSLVRAASSYQGHKYLLPLTQHYVAFFYNKKVFAQHGLKPRATGPNFWRYAPRSRPMVWYPLPWGPRTNGRRSSGLTCCCCELHPMNFVSS